MPQNVADADLWTVTVQCAADGEAVDGASQLLPAQDLADRARRLYNRSIAAKGGDFYVPLTAAYVNTNARFTEDWGGAPYYNSNVGGVGNLVFPIIVPHIGCEIDNVVVRCTGLYAAGAHAGDLGTRPEVTLVSTLRATGVSANEANAFSPTVTSGLYEAMHDIDLGGGLALPLDGTKFYFLAITGEGGANALVDKFAVYCATITLAAV